MQRTVSPPRRLTPPGTPNRMNMGRENRIAPAAKALRARSLAANSDAEYFGYVNGKYKNMDCMTRYVPQLLSPTPIVLAIQWTEWRLVHANKHRISMLLGKINLQNVGNVPKRKQPMGMKNDAINPGTNRASGAPKPGVDTMIGSA
jgi:hypothetical protein